MSVLGSMASQRAEKSRAVYRPHVLSILLWLALAIAPARTLRALLTVLLGKRVRGWNLLYLAAADHPFYYDHWVRRGEPHLRQAFLDSCQASEPLSIGCLILSVGEDAAAWATLKSVREALPLTMPIWTDVAALADDGVTVIARETPLIQLLDSIRSADWLLTLRAGDLVSPALGQVLRHAAPKPADHSVVFWDEDAWCAGRRQHPWIKPGWDPILFRARDGVTGSGLTATRAVRSHSGGAYFDAAGFAQVVAGLLAEDGVGPLHIPLILTHRLDGAPFVQRDLHARIVENNPGALLPVTPKIWPVVSIIIPTRDRADLLETCLTGLARLTYPGPIELLIVDNDSVEARTEALFANAERDGARILRRPGPFNYAALTNHAVSMASGEILCLLNNDIEMIDGDWLTHMVRYAIIDCVGAVGARLLYPSGEIQHVGIAIGIGGAAGHVQKGVDPADTKRFEWHAYSRIVSAVTGACMVVARSKFEAVDGMDSKGFAIDFNDVDFCLRLKTLGLTNIFAVEATLIHQESKSRGSTRSPEGAEQFAHELKLLRSRWHTEGLDDPHYSPMFRRECERCILAF